MIRSLRLSLRFLLPLLLAILAVAYLSIPLVDSLMQRWFVRDLDMRSTLIARSFEEPLGDLLESKSHARIDALLERATVDERLYALALCDSEGRLIQKTRSFPASIECSVRTLARDGAGFLLESSRGPLHVSTVDLKRSDGAFATLVMLHDMSFVQRRSEDTRQYILLLFTGLGVLVALITIAGGPVGAPAGIAGVRDPARRYAWSGRFLDDARAPPLSPRRSCARARDAAGSRGPATTGDRIPRELDAPGPAAGGARPPG